MESNNDYLDFDEAVQFLKTTPSTLYKWLQAGKIPGHKLGRQWRFLKDELEIHISGKGSKIQIQKDFLQLTELLLVRSSSQEENMNTNIHQLSEKIIWDAFDHGSRLVHIYPAKGKFEISYRMKSGMEKLSTVQEDFFIELDNSLKEISSEAGDGVSRRMYLQRESGDSLQIRYHKIETLAGPRVTLKMWQADEGVLPLDQIVPADQPLVLLNFKAWAARPSGVLIVSGTPGSGKTTTVYSLLNEIKKRNRVIFTLEETADLVLDGINQVELKGNTSENFEKAYSQIYNSDPDVVCFLLGMNQEISEKIFNAAFELSASGHLVILQVDQPSWQAALEFAKKNTKYPEKQMEENITGVSCQRLVEVNGKLKAVYEFWKQA